MKMSKPSSSLKEKAETSYSICAKAYLTCEVCKPQNKCGSGNCPLVNVLWVRLEDVKEIVKEEMAELKQKILRIISECCSCDVQLLNRKLEELLKEGD